MPLTGDIVSATNSGRLGTVRDIRDLSDGFFAYYIVWLDANEASWLLSGEIQSVPSIWHVFERVLSMKRGF